MINKGTLVGVDIGTLCGVAWQKDSVIRHIRFDTSKARISGGGMRPLMLRRHLLELFDEIIAKVHFSEKEAADLIL